MGADPAFRPSVKADSLIVVVIVVIIIVVPVIVIPAIGILYLAIHRSKILSSILQLICPAHSAWGCHHVGTLQSTAILVTEWLQPCYIYVKK